MFTDKLKNIKKKELHKVKDVYINTYLGYRQIQEIYDNYRVVDDKNRSWYLHGDTKVYFE